MSLSTGQWHQTHCKTCKRIANLEGTKTVAYTFTICRLQPYSTSVGWKKDGELKIMKFTLKNSWKSQYWSSWSPLHQSDPEIGLQHEKSFNRHHQGHRWQHTLLILTTFSSILLFWCAVHTIAFSVLKILFLIFISH